MSYGHLFAFDSGFDTFSKIFIDFGVKRAFPLPELCKYLCWTEEVNLAICFQCYAGFGFPSSQVIETIVCTADGTWSYTPICQASRCPPLATPENGKGTILAGKGSNYGTIVR